MNVISDTLLDLVCIRYFTGFLYKIYRVGQIKRHQVVSCVVLKHDLENFNGFGI